MTDKDTRQTLIARNVKVTAPSRYATLWDYTQQLIAAEIAACRLRAQLVRYAQANGAKVTEIGGELVIEYPQK